MVSLLSTIQFSICVLSPRYTSFRIMEFLITQLFPTNTSLNRTEFSTTPFTIQPLDIRLFFTTAPGLYFAGGRSSILDLISRLLLEEIVSDLRLQEIHVGLVIGFHSGNIAPVVCRSYSRRSSSDSCSGSEYPLQNHCGLPGAAFSISSISCLLRIT